MWVLGGGEMRGDRRRVLDPDGRFAVPSAHVEAMAPFVDVSLFRLREW